MQKLMTPVRSAFEKLQFEAIHKIREAQAVFENVALLRSQGDRQNVLLALVERAFKGSGISLNLVDEAEAELTVLISSEYPPAHDTGAPIGRVYPLADWDSDSIESFLQNQGGAQRSLPLVKICVVGESDSGKSELIQSLVDPESQFQKNAVSEDSHARFLATKTSLLQFRETRGRHACDLKIAMAAWESDVALLTVDAREKLHPKTKRLIFLLALSGVRRLIVAVTKMEQNERAQSFYREVVEEVNHLLTSTTQMNLTGVIPISREPLAWYEGETLLHHLERLPLPAVESMEPLRLPIQWTKGRVIAGRVHSGRLHRGDEVVILPSGEIDEVSEIYSGEEASSFGIAEDAVTIKLKKGESMVPGSLLVHRKNYPVRSSELDATLLWVDSEAPEVARSYRLYHSGVLVTAHLKEVKSCLQLDSYAWAEGDHLQTGEVGHVSLTTAAPLYFDNFFENRAFGRFLLLHGEVDRVIGVGIIRGPLRQRQDVVTSLERLSSEHVVVDPTLVSRQQRRQRYQHRSAVLWFTGLSSSGKSAVAKETEKKLFQRGCHTLFLDGDNVRSGFNGDLGFTQEERSESNRRVAELAALVHEQGQIVICSFISGCEAHRAFARSLIGDDFYLFFVDCPLEVCQQRDPKGLYAKAEAGELLSFTGISLPYERPKNPELVLKSNEERPDKLSGRVIELLERRGVI